LDDKSQWLLYKKVKAFVHANSLSAGTTVGMVLNTEEFGRDGSFSLYHHKSWSSLYSL